jgi:tetratricopeptide (TPR) repeat protein
MNRHLRKTVATVATCVALGSPAIAKKKKDADLPSTPAAPAAAAPAAQGAPVAAPTVESSAPPSKTLERALKLYDSEDYYMSSIELNKVVERQSGDDEGNVQRAEFFMGKTLFNLKFYSASLSYFTKIVDKGPAHRYYQKTLQWLASLSRFLPESAGVLEKIGKYNRQDLEQPALEPVRNELYYLLGRYHYTKGNFKEALELFALVPESSEFFARTKFLEGIVHVRDNQGKEAAESFRQILRKAKSGDKATLEFEDLANLSLARVFYATKQFPQSIKFFDKIPSESPDWLPSLFESSWAHYQIDGDSKALGNIHTLNAPFFENEFYPESLILRAVIYFQRCNYDRAMETIVEFNQTYPALREEILSVIKKFQDNAEFYKYVLKIRSGEAGLSERVQRAAEGALNDRTLAKTLDYVNELERELRQVDKADPSWKSTAVAGTVLQDLTLQKSIAENEAGGLARKRLERLAGEIQELIKQAIKIEYETLQGQKGVLEATIKNEQVTVSGTAKKVVNISADDEHLYWKFNGEYWKDELGYYRFRVVNRCEQQRGGATALPPT